MANPLCLTWKCDLVSFDIGSPPLKSDLIVGVIEMVVNKVDNNSIKICHHLNYILTDIEKYLNLR